MATIAETPPGKDLPGKADRAFLGHPKGLAYLAFTEAWERFSYYGMTALVVLYMVNQLLLPGHVENIAGFPGFRAALERVFGPMSTQALASPVSYRAYIAGNARNAGDAVERCTPLHALRYRTGSESLFL